MRYLALDVGTKTIGLAASDEGGVVAMPLRTLERHGGRRDVEAVATALRETGAQGLVLGLPLDLDGQEGDSARRVRALGAGLMTQLGCPVHYWDERFSTAQAERALLEGNVSRRRRKQVVNHIAATLILQSFLDRGTGVGDGAVDPSSVEGGRAR
jgi:putative Holliday junction resolvase